MSGKPRDPRHKAPRGGPIGRAPKGEAGKQPHGKRPVKGYGSKHLGGRPPKGGRPGERPGKPPKRTRPHARPASRPVKAATSSGCVLALACWAGAVAAVAAVWRPL